jgi:hypothetical protein
LDIEQNGEIDNLEIGLTGIERKWVVRQRDEGIFTACSAAAIFSAGTRLKSEVVEAVTCDQ